MPPEVTGMMGDDRRTIEEIDADIDAVRQELRNREDPWTFGDWRYAWDQHPDLREKERQLFLERDRARYSED